MSWSDLTCCPGLPPLGKPRSADYVSRALTRHSGDWWGWRTHETGTVSYSMRWASSLDKYRTSCAQSVDPLLGLGCIIEEISLSSATVAVCNPRDTHTPTSTALSRPRSTSHHPSRPTPTRPAPTRPVPSRPMPIPPCPVTPTHPHPILSHPMPSVRHVILCLLRNKQLLEY